MPPPKPAGNSRQHQPGACDQCFALRSVKKAVMVAVASVMSYALGWLLVRRLLVPWPINVLLLSDTALPQSELEYLSQMQRLSPGLLKNLFMTTETIRYDEAFRARLAHFG